MALGQIIRKKREEMGLTLDELSRRTQYSKPYLSTIETGRVKNPPGDDLLTRLEQILGFDSGLLTHIAHMERLPADLRQAFEEHRAENDQWRTLIRHMLKDGQIPETMMNSEPFQQLIREQGDSNIEPAVIAGKLVPVLNRVSAGYPADYDDMGYPPGGADDYVRCPDIHDSQAFALRVVGDSMEPKYSQGDIVIFSPNAEVNSGDDCCIRMTEPHETTFKQVFFEQNGTIRLQPRNHKYSPTVLHREKVNGISKAIIRYERLGNSN